MRPLWGCRSGRKGKKPGLARTKIKKTLYVAMPLPGASDYRNREDLIPFGFEPLFGGIERMSHVRCVAIAKL